jgi:hypothetical protein
MEIDEYVQIMGRIFTKLDASGLKRGEIAIAILQEVSKDRRMEQVKQEREKRQNDATPRQIGFLKDLGVDIPEGLSKQEASRMIDAEVGPAF